MDAAHRERLERARLKNLEYMRQALFDFTDCCVRNNRLDEQQHQQQPTPTPQQKPPPPPKNSNTSVYVTGLATYIACRQLEGMCAKIGKVRRIKFYKDERGGLKVGRTCGVGCLPPWVREARGLTTGAVACVCSAAAAEFKPKTAAEPPPSHSKDASQPEPERLFVLESAQDTHAGDLSEAAASEGSSAHSTAVTETQAAAADSRSDSAQLDLPSKSVVLKRVWNPLDAQPHAASFFDELEDDMRSECTKFGAVDHVHIVADGSVLVRFHALESAIKCLQVMHGRWFDGRQIAARFDQSTPEDPEDADTKLEAFLASIG
ncbi:hypothetical protein PybrP1_000568 [[Pythium] brassicae (nom. inval.)]|nr:hypothetical protein PybrP1_000568 [[Pythium] brassicae (nom. inval.)]